MQETISHRIEDQRGDDDSGGTVRRLGPTGAGRRGNAAWS